MVGTYVLSARGFYDAYYNRARKVRALIKRDFETVFAEGGRSYPDPGDASAAFRPRRDGRRGPGASCISTTSSR